VKKRRSGSHISFGGYLAFFLLVTFIITCAMLIYGYVRDRVSGTGAIAGIMLVVVFVLAAFCTVFDLVRHRLTVDKPVDHILAATKKIANGNFDVKLKPVHACRHYDAYDLIMENINKMAAELAKNEVLKTDFISNVSHEIKTPLAVIGNYAALLRDEALSDEIKEEYIENIFQATRRLTDLVANILKLNKLENQVIREEKSLINLADFFGELILSFEETLDRKHLTLHCNLDEITAPADRTFLEIIGNNLLSNAIKFTDDGGSIFVSLGREADNIVLSVEDSGCGMSSETGAHIFDKFYQGDTSHAEEGNGLGLALVKRVIDNMGGEISVKSELNKGSLFTVKWKA